MAKATIKIPKTHSGRFTLNCGSNQSTTATKIASSSIQPKMACAVYHSGGLVFIFQRASNGILNRGNLEVKLKSKAVTATLHTVRHHKDRHNSDNISSRQEEQLRN